MILDEFHYAPRPDAEGFTDGARVRPRGGVHGRGGAPARAHPRPQRVPDPDGVFFLSDIDLTGFGPYYGDVWSDLEDFEASR